MSNNNIPQDTLSNLRAGMEALKNHLPSSGLISDREIRQAMRLKSIWMNHVVIGEFLTLPIVTIILTTMALATGMNLWLIVVFAIVAFADTFLDLRTFAVSKHWIQEETLVGLSRRLISQKKERRRQTIVSTSLMMPWVIWFVYEYLKHCAPSLSEEMFKWVMGIMSGGILLVAIGVILLVYRKAQRTNDEMIRSLSDSADATGEA